MLITTAQVHTDGSHPLCVMDVGGAEMSCKGLFSPAHVAGAWVETKFRMFGYVLIPRLKPIPPSRFVIVGMQLRQRTPLTVSDPACAVAVTIAIALI